MREGTCSNFLTVREIMRLNYANARNVATGEERIGNARESTTEKERTGYRVLETSRNG